MTQQDLLTIWAEEAKEALDAKKSGVILDLWKVVAERKVYVNENWEVFVSVFNMESLGSLEVLSDTKLWKCA